MKVLWKEKSGVMVCYAKGEINIDTVSELRAAFSHIIDNKFRKVLLNLNELEYIDSLGIACLIELSKKLAEIEGVVFLSNLSPKIRSIFTITRLESRFKIYDTEEEALKDFYGY